MKLTNLPVIYLIKKPLISYLKTLKFGRLFRDVSFMYQNGLILKTSKLEVTTDTINGNLYFVQSQQIIPYEQMISEAEKDNDQSYFAGKNAEVITKFNSFCHSTIKLFRIIVLNGYILSIDTDCNSSVLYSQFRQFIPQFNRAAYFTNQRIDPEAPLATKEEILLFKKRDDTAAETTQCSIITNPAILFRFQKHLTLPDLPLDESKLVDEWSTVAQHPLLLPNPYLQAVLGELYNKELAQEFHELVAKGASLQDLILRAESIITNQQ